MDRTFMFALSCYIRVAIISFAGQLVGLAICNEMMARKKSLKVLMSWLVVKTGFLLFQYCWVEFFASGSDAGNLFVAVSNIWSTLITGALFYYTYEGELLKTILGMCLSETVMSVMLSPCIILVNLLESRTNVMDFEGAFQWMDLLIFVLVAVLYLAVRKVLSPVLRKFRPFQIKHKKLWWCFWIIYLALFQLPNLLNIQQNVSKGVFTSLGHLVGGITVIVTAYFLYQKYQYRIRTANEYLQLQLRLMEDQYMAIQQQISRMEKGCQIVDDQMEELMQIQEKSALSSDEKQNSFRLRISSYLEDLRLEYEQLQAGIYCNDWIVDAVLYGQIEAARRQGIEVACSLQGYKRGKINEEDLAQLFFELLDYGIQESRKGEKKRLSLQAGVVKNQLIIQLLITPGKCRKYKGSAIKEVLEKYGGIWNGQQLEQGYQIVAALNYLSDGD